MDIGLKPGQNWVSTAAPLCSLLCNGNRAKTKGGPVLSGMAQLLLEVMTFISTWQDLKKFDLLIPDDEARSERKKVDLLIPDDEARSEEMSTFSSLTMKQDLKKARSEERLIFSSLTMKQDLKKARSEERLIFLSLTMKQDLKKG
ncbi:hypothetical protein GQ457_15G026080 [Hibiscus cannabinus]